MKKNYQKGIAIFIAVISVSALLLIAMSISNISYKEQLISSSARDSRVAFFAADSGAECAMFHDLKGGSDTDDLFNFETPMSLTPGAPDPIPESGSIVCGENTPPITTSIAGSNPVITTTFHFNMPAPTVACAVVRVKKTYTVSGKILTEIRSSGYNNTCSSGNSVDDGPRNLERALKIDY